MYDSIGRSAAAVLNKILISQVNPQIKYMYRLPKLNIIGGELNSIFYDINSWIPLLQGTLQETYIINELQ